MARDYRSSNIIYNPVEAEKKRHSSGRDYRSSVSGSGTRDYRTATVKQEEQKGVTPEPALPALPTLGESVNRMNAMALPSTYGNVTPSTKLGIVAPQNNAFKQSTGEQKKATAKLMATAPTVRTYENVEKDAQPFSNLRKAPIIGPVYRGLDKLQQFTEPAAKIAQEYYTPGAGLAPIAGFTGAVGSAISKVAPKLGLGTGLGQTVAREAIKEGAAGAVLGAGQSLAAHPEAGFKGAGEGAAYGGVLGGALGPVAPILGKAIKGVGKYVQNIARETTADNLAFQNAVNQIGESGAKAEIGKRNLADLDEQIQSLSNGNVANKAEQFNALANERNAVIDYIKQHEPDFEAPKPRVRASNQQTSVARANEPIVLTADNPTATLQTGSKRRVEYVPDQPAQAPKAGEGIRANYATQLEHGNYSPEMQQRINEADQTYTKAVNADDNATALNMVQQDLQGTETKFMNHNQGGSLHTAIGYQLMKRLDAMGQFDRAAMISDKLAADLTKQGQGNQAAIILKSLSPEGQLMKFIRSAEANGKTVTPKDQAAFKQEARTLQESLGTGIRENKLDEILARAEKDGKISAEDNAYIQSYIDRGEKVINPEGKKTPPVEDFNLEDVFPEMKNPKKREKVISFFDKQEQAALERIKASKNRLNSLPVDLWRDHAIVVSSQIIKGTIKAATHVEDLVKLFGEEIRPVATQVYEAAKGIVKAARKASSEGKLDEAIKAMDKATGKAAAEKALVQEMANHVKKVIEDAKNGNVLEGDLQKLRDYSDEISDMLEGKPTRELSQEKKYLQNVKTLAKKIAEVESNAIPTDQANKEIASLIRKVANDPLVPKEARVKMDAQTDNALNNIASDVMKRTRKAPTPTTLQEKIVEKYIKQTPEISAEHITKLRELAKDVTRLERAQGMDADIAMQKIMNSYEKSTIWDKAQAIRYIGMLLNTGTQTVNALSGPIMATNEAAVNVFANMVNLGMHKMMGRERVVSTYGANPLRFLAGWLKNVGAGAKAGYHGVNPAGLQSVSEVRGLTFKSMYNPLGQAERILGAVAKGADYAAYKTTFESELRKQGYLAAKKAGIKGSTQIKAFIKNYVNDPPANGLELADKAGRDITFQSKTSTGGQIAQSVAASHPSIKIGTSFVAPFIRTPLNIASTAVKMTPAGLIKGAIGLARNKGNPIAQREALRSLGLGIVGTAGLSPLGFYLSKIGIITGANDSGNKDVNAVREQAGKGKYRFNTSAFSRYVSAMLNLEGPDAAEKAAKYREGDSTLDYNKFQPLAMPLAIGAGLEDSKGKGKLAKAEQAGTEAFGSFYGMSTLKGVQDLFSSDFSGTIGEKAVKLPLNIAESFAKSFSPGFLAQEARRQDEVQRKTSFNNGIVKDVTDYYKSRMPGETPFGTIPDRFTSKSLPANITTLGETKKNPTGAVGSYLNPYKSQASTYNKAAAIVSDLIDRTGNEKLAPTAPEKKVEGTNKKTGIYGTVDIPPKRYEQLQQEIGKEITSKIIAIKPSLTDQQKADTIAKIYKDVREKYMNRVKMELGIVVR